MAKAPASDKTSFASCSGVPMERRHPLTGGAGSKDCIKIWADSSSLGHLQHALALLLSCWKGCVFAWFVLRVCSPLWKILQTISINLEHANNWKLPGKIPACPPLHPIIVLIREYW